MVLMIGPPLRENIITKSERIFERMQRPEESLIGQHVHHAFAPPDEARKKGWTDLDLEDDQIQSASLELKTGTSLWEVNHVFSSKQGYFTNDLKKYGKEIKLQDETILQKGKIYVIESFERIGLPENIKVSADAKSTTGRTGCLCQLLSEEGRYSSLPNGYGSLFNTKQHVYSFIEPHAFNIILKPLQTRFLQLRFRIEGTGYLNLEELKNSYGKEKGVNWYINNKKIPLEETLDENALKMTLSTKRFYKQKKTKIPLDLTQKEKYNQNDFFEEIQGNGEALMEPNTFYLFGTREYIEMGPYAGHLTRTDTFMESSLFSHFAGLFDPWFKGGITLEMWSPKPILLREGDYIGKVYIEESLGQVSEKAGYQGAYKNQDAPKLPKIFKSKELKENKKEG